MREFVFIGACFLISGCASHLAPFQRASSNPSESQPGYTLTPGASAQTFNIKVDLKGQGDAKYAVYYAYRAVGEECLSRSFGYFDVGVNDPANVDGYCYPGPDHPALAVEFTTAGLDARPQAFVVGSLLGKTNTKLEKGDTIIGLEGASPRSVANFKAVVFRLSQAGRKTVDLKIKRAGQDLEIKEPIALLKNSLMGSTQLDLFRSRVKSP